jgi:hypothetical protein
MHYIKEFMESGAILIESIFSKDAECGNYLEQ